MATFLLGERTACTVKQTCATLLLVVLGLQPAVHVLLPDQVQPLFARKLSSKRIAMHVLLNGELSMQLHVLSQTPACTLGLLTRMSYTRLARSF
jgi:hypothetical protein